MLALACGFKSLSIAVFKASPQATPDLIGRIDVMDNGVLKVSYAYAFLCETLTYSNGLVPSLSLNRNPVPLIFVKTFRFT